MQIAHLRWILQVAQSGSITKAARLLHASPSSVSQAVRSIETKVGAELFERSVHGTTLSEAGHQLLPELRSIVEAHDRLIEASSDLGASVNSLAINTLLGYGGPNLIALNDDNLTANGARITTRTLPYFDWSDPTAAVRSREADAVILGGPTMFDADLASYELELLPMVAIVNESMFGDHDAVTVSDLDSVGWILPDPGILDERYLRFWTLDSIRGGPPPSCGTMVEHPAQVQTIVAQGEGVIASIEPVARRFSVGRQRIVPIERSPEVSICLKFRPDHPAREPLEVIADALRRSGPLRIA